MLVKGLEVALSDLIISLSGAALAIVIGVAAFFIQKWIQVVDETIKEHSSDFKYISKQISALESKQSAQAENIAKAIHSQITAIKFPHSKLDKIEQEVTFVKSVVQEKLLPEIEKQVENYGRVVVLEKSIGQQNEKLLTMFNALKLLVEKKQRDQK